MTIAWIVALAALLAGGLITFFFDPFGLPPDLWGALDQRASVVSMFIGAIGLPLAVAALLHQMRTGTKPSAKSESSEHPSGTDASAPTAATTSRSTTVSSETRPPAKESLIPPSQPRLPRTSTPINAADPQISIPGDHFAFRDNIIEKAVGVEHHHYHPPRPSRSPGHIVEGEIPQKPRGFQPREELLRRLADLLGGPSTLLSEPQNRHGKEKGTGGAVAICAMAGIPGVGKTMLAASYAWACQDAGWPVIAWIPAETTDQIVTGLASLASRLGERRPDDDTPTAAARAKAWLAATTHPALLVFDNATDVAAVRSWTPATGATRVIITTRHGAFLRAYQPLEVEVFTPEQAIAFLRERTGLTDAEGAKAVASELGHLPLALAQAAAVIARLRIDYAAYLEQLRSVRLSENLTAESGDAYPTSTAEASCSQSLTPRPLFRSPAGYCRSLRFYHPPVFHWPC
ncbi:hypothetical protein GCM10010106_02840 [Thermopolyspora flexuosa]|nr:NB-ARC domain-containing protein [Thermopolyspora flexuosa]GGM60495.1 hypothetical protein GCM10010106_02840 [Thermopolyspora flexuosa]